MSLKIYVSGIIIATILLLSALIYLIFKTNPQSAPLEIFVAFFICLYLVLTGIFTLIGYFIRAKISKGQVIFSYLKTSIRQALLLSLAMVGLLLLNQVEVLKWWSAIILIIVISILEVFFQTR